MADETKIKVSADVEDAIAGMKKVGGAVEETAKKVEGVGKSIQNSSGLWQDAEGRWRVTSGRFASGAEKAAAGVEGIGKSSEEAKKKVGGFAGALEQVAIGALRKVGEAALEAGVKIAGLLVGGIAKSVDVAADFEVGMNNFSAAAGKSLDAAGLKTQDFQALFLDLGKRLPVSTMEVTDAATAMVKGGIDPATVAAGGLESTLKFAAAAQMDLTAAAEVGVSQLAVFTSATASATEKTAFLAKAQDLLVKAAGASKADVAGLSDAVLMSAGQAKSAGLEYEDFITSVTMITDAMPSASEAGTSFKNMLVRLQPTTKAAKTAFSELGLMTFDTERAMQALRGQGVEPLSTDADVLRGQLAKLADANGMTAKETEKFLNVFDKSSFYDAQGQFIGMRAAAEKMQGAFKGLTEEQRMQAVQQIFGNDAMGAANVLIDGGTAGYDKYTTAMAGANGVNEQSAATQKGLKFQMEQFNGSMEALAITVGTKVLPYVNKFMEEFVMPAINGLLDLVGNTESVGGAMDGMATAIGPALDGAKKIMADVVTWVQTNWPAIQTTIGDVINGAVAFFNDPLTPTLNKVLEVIKSVVNWWTTNWPLIQPIVTDVGNAIGTVMNDVVLPVIGKILEAAKGLVAWFITHWPEIKKVVEPVVKAMVAQLEKVRDTIVLAFDQAASIGTKIGEIKTVVETKWKEITTFVEGLPAAFVTAGQAIIQGLINGVVSKLKVFSDLWQQLSNDPIKAMQDILNIHSPSQVMFDMGENIMKGLIYGVLSYRNQAVSVMQQTAQAIQGAAESVYQTPATVGSVSAGDDAFDRGAGRLGALAPAMAAAGNGMVGSLPQGFSATINVQLTMDGAVFASTVISIVQGVLQQERQRYGQ